MKIRSIILFVSAILILCAGCTKDSDSIKMFVQTERFFSNTKTLIDENDIVCWVNNDEISVSGDVCNVMVDDINHYTYISVENNSENGYTFAYPSDMATTSKGQNVEETKKVTYRFPEIQSITSGNIVKVPMVSYAPDGQDGLELIFRNVGAVMAITINKEESMGTIDVESIRITSQHSPISGTAIVPDASSTAPQLVFNSDAVKTKRVDITDGVNFSGLKTYYVTMPPISGNPNDYYTISVIYNHHLQNENGENIVIKKVCSRKLKEGFSALCTRQALLSIPFTLDEGLSVVMGKLEGTGEVDDPYLISSLADLNLLKTLNQNNGIAESKNYDIACFRQTQDISGFAGGIGQDQPFKGTYDGGGHSITLDGNCGVFAQVGGGTSLTNIKKLIVNGSISINNKYIVGSLVDVISGSNVTLSECQNNAVIMGQNLHSPLFIGGICAKVEPLCGNIDIDNCHNHGAIGLMFIHSAIVGGICGYYEGEDQGMCINTCTNNAGINIFQSSNPSFQGSIVGKIASGSIIIDGIETLPQ